LIVETISDIVSAFEPMVCPFIQIIQGWYRTKGSFCQAVYHVIEHFNILAVNTKHDNEQQGKRHTTNQQS
jgi:hypothetical protein